MLRVMDADFVEFLDKKFGKVGERFDQVDEKLGTLDRRVEDVQKSLLYEMRELEERLGDRITRLEEAVGGLTNSIDRLLKLYEDVRVEQAAIIADLNRIKAVLKEKLGVEL